MITVNGVKKELLKRSSKAKEVKQFSLDEYLFKEQLAFVQDPARFVTAVCSVRAGKTVACASDLIYTAVNSPGTTGLYITLTRASAKRIVWTDLHKINREYNLSAVANETDLSFKFPNGSVIYCSGADTSSEIEKFRGLSNVILAYVDESQAFPSHLKDLVEEILVKRLYDTNGRCRLIGTPGPIPAGYFYEASQSPQWSHHAWTIHSNPWIVKKSGKTAEELIQQDCERMGVTLDDPAIQRECFGRWVLDSKSLLLNYDKDKNHYEELPKQKYHYILGVDLGLIDADALALLAWAPTDPNVYLIEEKVTTGQDITALMSQIETIRAKYEIDKIIIDAGGLGKKIAEELIRRHKVPLTAADKARKMENVALLNDFLRTGRFKAKASSKFAQDTYLVEIDRDKSTPEKIKVSDRYHSDIMDAVLYAFKETYAYTYTVPVKRAKYGSEEWAKEEQDNMFKHELEIMEKEQELQQKLNNPWNFDDYS